VGERRDGPLAGPPSIRDPAAAMLRRLLALLLGLVAAVAFLELALRVVGRGPLDPPAPSEEPAHYEPHPRMGWVHRPGRFEVAGARATFLADGSRATAPVPAPRSAAAVVLVGGSFTEGYGVADEDTFGWRLAERGPLPVRNFGTGGHGTYQALLMLEEKLPQLAAAGAAPAVVVYGYMWHHQQRNVGFWRWRKQLVENSRASVAVPRLSLGPRGDLVRHPPEPWPAVGPSRHSAVLHTGVELWVRASTRDRLGDALVVTGRTLEAMARIARRAGGRLVVASLFAAPAETTFLLRNLARAGIDAVDCSIPDYATPRYRDPGTGHPTAEAHARYADCIAPTLQPPDRRSR